MPRARTTTPDTPNIRWGQRQRLEFIDFRLTWEGRFNRADLMERFGISVPQASNDIAEYQRWAPGNAIYDPRAKTYVTEPGFVPAFDQPPELYLNQLVALSSGVLEPADAAVPMEAIGEDRFATVPSAVRRVDPAVLRGVIRAIRDGRDIAIVYQSMSRIEPGRRWIGPRALVHDGRRWHTRAWSPDRNEYRDFVLARILAIEEDRLAEPRPAVDSAWEEIVEVVLVPHPGLTAAQKRAVARDFGMVRLRAIVRIRRALLHYFLRQYGLRREGAKLKAEENQVIVQNADAIWPAGAPHPELPFGPGET